MDNPTQSGVKASDAAFDILECVAFSPEPQGVTQIASKVGIAKGAAFKHLHTLTARGYLTQDAASARYKLGPRAWLLSKLAPRGDDVLEIATPFMQAARDASHLSVVLSVPLNRSALVLTTVGGTGTVEIGVRAGSQLTLNGSAQGKIFLAYGPKSLTDWLARQSISAATPKTIVSFDALMAEVGEIRRRGYALAPEETLLGVNALAVPIYDYSDTLIGSVGLVGSIQHLPPVPDEKIIQLVLDLGSAISRALGHGALHPERHSH